MYAIIDIILRVPPLFVIDELLKSSGFPSSSGNQSTFAPISDDLGVVSQSDLRDVFLSSLRLLLTTIGCLVSLGIFMLWTQNLITVYLYLMSVGVVFISYWRNSVCIQAITGPSAVLGVSESVVSLIKDIVPWHTEWNPASIVVLENLAVQCILASIFIKIHQGPQYKFLQWLLPVCFLGPSVLANVVLPESVMYHSPLFAAALPLALVQFVLWTSAVPVIQAMYSGYYHVHNVLSNFGMATFVETEWSRLNVPCVLLIFWWLRVAEHAVSLIAAYSYSGESLPIPTLAYQMSKSLLVSGCETLTAVLGMTSVVSYLCYYMGCLFQWALLTEEDEEKPIGTVSAMLFYILALQAGLTSCDPDKRLVRLSRNFCLLFTALLHFVHNYVHPLLLSLSASHNPSLHRHLRALGVCAFLIAFPVTLLVFLWSQHGLSTWLLAVSAFSIEVIVKVAVSLMIYSLFLLDAYRSTFWEKLDDYVYYIRAFGHIVEFSFGILLFMNSAWVLIFEAGGAVRAVMVGIHAYFNIWCDAQAGWRVFMKRRTAVNKINSLPEASSEQLEKLNDVCSICYQDMRSAKITRCNHYFHGVCLRKWLYVQDRCPLCHDILYRVSSQEQLAQ